MTATDLRPNLPLLHKNAAANGAYRVLLHRCSGPCLLKQHEPRTHGVSRASLSTLRTHARLLKGAHILMLALALCSVSHSVTSSHDLSRTSTIRSQVLCRCGSADRSVHLGALSGSSAAAVRCSRSVCCAIAPVSIVHQLPLRLVVGMRRLLYYHHPLASVWRRSGTLSNARQTINIRLSCASPIVPRVPCAM